MEDSRHTITLDNRSKITATGIADVLSYDEESIVARTQESILIIRGNELHISSFNSDKGVLAAGGSIAEISYDNEPVSKGSILSRLFK